MICNICNGPKLSKVSKKCLDCQKKSYQKNPIKCKYDLCYNFFIPKKRSREFFCSTLCAHDSYQKTKKKSYKISDEQFIRAVKESSSIHSALLSLGLCGTGGSYISYHNRIKALGLDTSHMKGQGWNKGKKFPPVRELSVYLKRGSTINSNSLRKRLISENVFEDKCCICSISIWQGRKLSLQLDHIDGDRTNNEIQNLRLLCPNCHSQTNTFAGRNKGRGKY